MPGVESRRGQANFLLEWEKRGQTQGRIHRKAVSAGETLIIGRDKDCNILLPEPTVSRKHVKLNIGLAGVRVQNLSRSGVTRLGDRAIAEAEWKPGQRLRIDVFDFALQPAASSSLRTPVPASPRHDPSPELRGAGPRPSTTPVVQIVWRNTDEGSSLKPQILALAPGKPITIGKDSSCDVVLRDPLASREHARIDVGADGVRVTDLGSTNGTVLGGEQIRQAFWRSGQMLEIGRHVFSIAALSAHNTIDKALTTSFLGNGPVGETTASVWRLRVFISYSRKDQAYADRLEADLRRSGFYVWIDRRIPYGEAWKLEIIESIKGSDTVVFLISPDSVESDWCRWELEQVRLHTKRLFPIRIKDMPLDALPAAIRDVQILPRSGAFDYGRDYPQLVKALNTDTAWNREHTRLLVQAVRWNAKGRPASMLLRGAELNNALVWVRLRPRKAEIAGQIQEYIERSRIGYRYRLGIRTGLMVFVLAGLALGAWQRQALLDWANASIARAYALLAGETSRKDGVIKSLEEKNARLQRFRSDFYGRLREVLSGLDVQEVGDRFIVPTGVLFDSGQARLIPSGITALAPIPDLIARVSRDRLSFDIDWVLQVNGHTDKRPINTPQFPSNLELSLARSATVVNYLVENGVPKTRLIAAGYGDTQLLEQGNTDEDHRKNRRIELKLTDR